MGNRWMLPTAALCLVAGLGAFPPAAAAKPTAAQKCSAAKARAVGACAAAQLGCVRQAALGSGTPAQPCLTGANAKLATAFGKAEAKAHGGCPTTGDAPALATLVDALATGSLSALLPPTTTSTLPDTTTTTLPPPCFQGATAEVTANWMSNGLLGLAAGDDICVTNGWNHVCDYLELRQAQSLGEFASVSNLTTGWVNRTTTEMVNGQPSAPGLGGNCVGWTFYGNHLADGEYVTFASGVPTFHLDNDTFYDQIDTSHTILLDLECAPTTRSILCCAAGCLP